MTTQSPRPIIFLGFANDKEGQGYLRNLTAERNGIEEAFTRLGEICELIIKPDLSIKGLFDTFANPAYQDRIVLFHFGGHAGSDHLLLESSTGENSEANSEGWVSFLGQQRSLKLVFLNGCSSIEQSKKLREAGVPAVIGTDTKIKDGIATQLSVSFYEALASGAELEQAWEKAIGEVKTHLPAGEDMRSLVLDEEEEVPNQIPTGLPWRLEFSSDYPRINHWNLPEEAEYPLFGLELDRAYLGTNTKPGHPYPGLQPFKEEEADLFFGRGKEIRQLYEMCQDEYPLILLTGAAGVGKTSLVKAGLIPRTVGRLRVHYLEADSSEKELTLGGMLLEALAEAGRAKNMKALPPDLQNSPEHQRIEELQTAMEHCEGFAREVLEHELARLAIERKFSGNLRQYWQAIEHDGGEALILVLDHLENLPTWQNRKLDPEDWQAFVQTVKSIFHGGEENLKGKIILSYREPFHPQVTAKLMGEGMLSRKLILSPLSHAGMVEAITGVANGRLQDHFQLSLDQSKELDLPSIIADDLREDADSPINPVFQEILQQLWKKSQGERNITRYISVRMYQELKQSGELMGSLLQQQLRKVGRGSQDLRNAASAGLIIDFLYLHTDVMGHSKTLDWSKVVEAYQDRRELIEDLWERCQDHYLISVNQQNQSRLFHDLLAPVVIREYTLSFRPGQWASRVIESRVEEIRSESGSKSQKILLGDREIAIVKRGLRGMRCLRPTEQELLQASEQAKAKRDSEKQRNQRFLMGLGAFILLFAVLAAWQWREAQVNLELSQSSELAYQAQEIATKDLTLGLRMAGKAYGILKEKSGHITSQTLSDLFHAQDSVPIYHHLFQHSSPVYSVTISPDGKQVLTASGNGEVRLWSKEGKPGRIIQQPIGVIAASFSPTGNQILTLDADSVRLWDLKGKRLSQLKAGGMFSSAETLWAFSTDGMRIFPTPIATKDSAYVRWLEEIRKPKHRYFSPSHLEGILILDGRDLFELTAFESDSFRRPLAADIRAVAHSPDGQFLATAAYKDKADFSLISIWKSENVVQLLRSFKYPGEVQGVWIGNDGQELWVADRNGQVRHYDFSASFLHVLSKGENGLDQAYFSSFGPELIIKARRKLKIRNEAGQVVESFDHQGRVIKLAISPGENSHIATADNQGVIYLWDRKLQSTVPLEDSGDNLMFPPSGLQFSPDGTKLCAIYKGEKVKIWQRDGRFYGEYEPGSVGLVAFSEDGRQLAISLADSTVALLSLVPAQDSLLPLAIGSEIQALAFSPNDKDLWVLNSDNQVQIWRKGEKLGEWSHPHSPEEKSSLNLIAFSPNGKRIATGKTEVAIWKQNGAFLHTLHHQDKVSALAFSPDGKQILTACHDGKARLWKSDGTLIAEFPHSEEVLSARFSPDGSQIITSTIDGSVRRWWSANHIHQWLKEETRRSKAWKSGK